MEVVVLVGPPGSGKTRWAMDNYPTLYKLPCPKSSGTYWDDYDGQETVLVDEMYGHYFSWSFLLQLTDRYPMTVPVHGGAGHQFVSRRIIFTSNSLPEEWYSKPTIATQWNAANPFRRRVTHLLLTGALHVPPPALPMAEVQPADDDFEEFIAAAFDFLE